MTIELKDYDIISMDFKSLTGNNLFTHIDQIPMHKQSSMLFTLQIGEVSKVLADDFKVSVVIRPDTKKSGNSLVERGLMQYESFLPERVMTDIKNIIVNCDRGSLRASIPLLNEKFEWEYDGVPDSV
ncbi:MAG: hypothetical protein AAGA50_26740 [Pseudomonadota bacterium]